MFKHNGFSLIELLVIVAIISILSALAIPAYGNYVIKARVSELLTVAEGYKVKVLENAFLASDQVDSVFNLNTATIDRVSLQTATGEPKKHVIEIVAKMQTPEQQGIGLVQPATSELPLTIQLQGVEMGEIISWSCHVAMGYNNFVPNSCHNNELTIIES